MQGKVKLNKRQIKEDKFTTFMLSSKTRLQTNWQPFAMFAAAIILIIAAISWYTDSVTSRETNAAIELGQAELDLQRGNRLVAVTSYGQVIDKFDGTLSAERATFVLARLQFDLQNYSESQRFYEMYVAKYSENKLNYAAAIAGIAVILETQQSHEVAAQKFDEAISSYPSGPQVGDYQFSAMRNYLSAGNYQLATERLESIENKYPNTALALSAATLFAEKGNLPTP